MGKIISRIKYRRLIPSLLISAISVIPLAGCSTTTHDPPLIINVAAATSLTDALEEINTLYTRGNPNVTITPNFASSGTLQTQIENGAPVDVFLSAAAAQMDNL
ncbi:MAG: molybdate ABC transporter substrate-binding protein, partial [Dehalococcoidales bacterium]|nr:molybdate ABC transporter substrate-binding protein [Dehalococcoidales bacterium]